MSKLIQVSEHRYTLTDMHGVCYEIRKGPWHDTINGKKPLMWWVDDENTSSLYCDDTLEGCIKYIKRMEKDTTVGVWGIDW